MKKFAKLSLVAALAVAGTTASAANLAEAIQNVDVSGQFRFRAEEINTDFGTSNPNHTKTDVEVEVTAKVPVNDNVTAVFKIDNAGDDADTSIDKDTIAIEDYYFQYVNGSLTVLAGQQNIPGRLTDGGQGNGIVALYNAGDFTFGAASFMNVTATIAEVSTSAATTVSNQLNSVIAMGNVGPVSLLAQYADIEDTLDSYNVKADATVEGITVGVEYSETDWDANSKEFSTLKAYVSGSYDMLSATVAYGETGKDGSGSIDEAAETPAELLLWQVGSANVQDLEAFVIDASLALTDTVSLRAAYLDGEHGASNTDISETLGQISYKMSSNLNTYVRYSVKENGTDEDQDRARIEVQYTF